jgi:hypothetical protein
MRAFVPVSIGRRSRAAFEAGDSPAALVTGTSHLLDLARRFPIQTPRVFLDALDAQP